MFALRFSKLNLTLVERGWESFKRRWKGAEGWEGRACEAVVSSSLSIYLRVFHSCTYSHYTSLICLSILITAEDRGRGLIAQGRRSEGKFGFFGSHYVDTIVLLILLQSASPKIR